MVAKPHHVVVIGGGFGGLATARALSRARVLVTLIDRRNFHLFQPLLYQVATGGLSPANIASPLRWILHEQQNVQVLLGEVVDVDAQGRAVLLADGHRLPYDSLVIATGATHSYFGHPEWERFAPGLKTLEDATEIRRRVLIAFEAAERERDPARMHRWLSFVVVGGGPTGVELAGAIAEVARDSLRYDFRIINPADARIYLVEGSDRILRSFDPSLSAAATKSLKKIGVNVLLEAQVTNIDAGGVTYKHHGSEQRIDSHTVLWGAGVAASPLGKLIAERTGTDVDRAGRVMVDAECNLPKFPEIFVVGDLAHYRSADGPLPGVAQVAIQQGEHVAKIIANRLNGELTPAFSYNDYGSMATIGRSAAVADIKGFRFTGWFAWIAWLVVHLISLVSFQNRILVLMQWAWNYWTRNRAARLISGSELPPEFQVEDPMVPEQHPAAVEVAESIGAAPDSPASESSASENPPSETNGQSESMETTAPKVA